MTQGQVFVADAAKVKKLLSDARAEPTRKDGTSAVYVSRTKNMTFTLFDAGAGKIKVQVMSGCVC